MNFNILIVDDEEEAFKRYESIMGSYQKLKLLRAKHGPAAVNIVKNQQVDIVLLDQVFNSPDIPNDKLYYEEDGSLKMHAINSDRNILSEDMDRQGYYILKALRDAGYKGPILFVTSIAGELGQGDILCKSVSEMSNVDVIQKDNLENGLVDRIKKELNIFELQSLEEEILEVLNHLKDTSLKKNKVQRNLLLTEAKSRRRKGLLFIEKVIERLKDIPLISAKDVRESINSVSGSEEFVFEIVNPLELLQWCISKLNILEGTPSELWTYEGNNGLRYSFHLKKEGDKNLYLRIVHPEFSTDKGDVHPVNVGDFICKEVHKIAFSDRDPYWPGTHVIAYLEEGPNMTRLKEHISNKNILSKDVIQSYLEKVKTLISQSGGHGSITIDSLYTDASGNVYLSDSCLYECLNDDGKRALPELTFDNPQQRDIQALGTIVEYIVTGLKGAIQPNIGKSAFLDFLKECKNGTWDMSKTIPEIDSKIKIFRNGPFVTSIERDFAYSLSDFLFQKNLDALVYLNTNVLLKPPIANEVDVLIVRPGKIFWLDMKGSKFVEDTYRNDQMYKMKAKLDKLKQLASKIKVDNDFISAYCVLDDQVHKEIVQKITDSEKMLTRSISGVLKEIGNATNNIFDLMEFDNKFRPFYYQRHESTYEKTPSWKSRFGENYLPPVQRDYICDEIDCKDNPYYIRRYSLDDPEIEILSASAHRKLLLQTNDEIQLIKSMDKHSLHLLVPEEVIIVDSENEPNQIITGTVSTPSGGVIPITNPDIRWIYKVYRKPGKEYRGPYLLSDSIRELTEHQRLLLLSHYLEAIKSILNKKTGINKESLKVYMHKHKKEYFGVLDPILHGTIQKDDVLMVINALYDDNNILNEIISLTAQKPDVSSVVNILLTYLNAEIERKDDLRAIKKSIQSLGKQISMNKRGNMKHDHCQKRYTDDHSKMATSASSEKTISETQTKKEKNTGTNKAEIKQAESLIGKGSQEHSEMLCRREPYEAMQSEKRTAKQKDNKEIPETLPEAKLCKLFIGNLPHKAKEDDLHKLLTDYADVFSIRIIKDSNTGISKGYGFVEISSIETVDDLIKKLNGIEFMGRNLSVQKPINNKKRRH